MVKLNLIKIITGYKGGVGKTLTTLSLIIHHIRNNAKVIAVDGNANNQDLIDILTNLYDNDKKFLIDYDRWRFPIDEKEKELIAIEPNVPVWDGKDIWSFIATLINKEKFSGSTIIMDSHISLAYLGTDTFANLKIKEEKIKIETYFIWSLSAPDKQKDLDKITNSIKTMERVFGESYPSINQIHIFNPHEAKSPKTFFSRSLRKKWEKNQKQKKGIAITVDTLMELIKNVNIEFDYKTELSPSKLFDPWSGFFEEILNKVGKKAVLNILPIFQYFDLSNFTAGQTYSKNRNIRGIQEDIGDYYKYISNFNKMRNRLIKKSD